MKTRFLSVAEAEFSDAAAYYEDNAKGLGDRFVDHITSAINYLEQYPLIGNLVDRRVRKVSLRKFPYI